MTDARPADAPVLPTVDEEDRFWSLVEQAWARQGPEPAALRRLLLGRDPAVQKEGDELYAIDAWLAPFLSTLRELCGGLSQAELTALDRVVERKLHDLDRADIHEVTDGSDDGFLYARGFIVALGREFYEAVRARPVMAVTDAECEGLCYLLTHLHRERFGAWPETRSGISRESFSNGAGWQDA